MNSRGREITNDVAEELRRLLPGIQSEHTAIKVWRRLLTEDERERLGADFGECFRRHGTVGMWMEIKKVSFERALIEEALRLGQLDQATFDWLMRELGEKPSTQRSKRSPVWDAESGKLHLGKQLIRRVRIMKNPSNIQKILDAFEADGWPTSIRNPLSLGQQQLHETLRTLNTALKKIHFSSLAGGRVITWERC